MSGIVLTAYDGAILGPIAKFLGAIMNAIYLLMYNVFGVESIVFSIVLITIIIYMCLLPLTIKQQKFSKLSQKMQPEIQAIQDKYKNKKDQESMMAMQQETTLVYEKYGVSPSGSCIQLLIQMPILFALYRVFYNVPAYVTSIKSTFTGLVDGIIGTSGYANTLAKLMEETNFTTSSGLTANNVVEKLGDVSGSQLKDYIIDILYKLPSNGWEKLYDIFPDLSSTIASVDEHIQKFNYFLGLNISDTPASIIKLNFADKNFGFIILALLIPILSYLSQLISIKLMPQPTDDNNNKNKNSANDQMAQSMKTMNIMMPLMSFVICFTVPVGLGIYWACSGFVRVIQQFFINRHIQNLDLDDIIAKNQEKDRKKREKMGISENQIRNAANINTKSIDSKANYTSYANKELEVEKAKEAKKNAKAGSLASKANLVSDFNERNSRK